MTFRSLSKLPPATSRDSEKFDDIRESISSSHELEERRLPNLLCFACQERKQKSKKNGGYIIRHKRKKLKSLINVLNSKHYLFSSESPSTFHNLDAKVILPHATENNSSCARGGSVFNSLGASSVSSLSNVSSRSRKLASFSKNHRPKLPLNVNVPSVRFMKNILENRKNEGIEWIKIEECMDNEIVNDVIHMPRFCPSEKEKNTWGVSKLNDIPHNQKISTVIERVDSTSSSVSSLSPIYFHAQSKVQHTFACDKSPTTCTHDELLPQPDDVLKDNHHCVKYRGTGLSLPVLYKQNNFEKTDCDRVCANDITTDRDKSNLMISKKKEFTSTNNQEGLHNNRKHDTAPFSLSTHSYDKETPKIINSEVSILCKSLVNTHSVFIRQDNLEKPEREIPKEITHPLKINPLPARNKRIPNQKCVNLFDGSIGNLSSENDFESHEKSRSITINCLLRKVHKIDAALGSVGEFRDLNISPFGRCSRSPQSRCGHKNAVKQVYFNQNVQSYKRNKYLSISYPMEMRSEDDLDSFLSSKIDSAKSHDCIIFDNQGPLKRGGDYISSESSATIEQNFPKLLNEQVFKDGIIDAIKTFPSIELSMSSRSEDDQIRSIQNTDDKTGIIGFEGSRCTFVSWNLSTGETRQNDQMQANTKDNNSKCHKNIQDFERATDQMQLRAIQTPQPVVSIATPHMEKVSPSCIESQLFPAEKTYNIMHENKTVDRAETISSAAKQEQSNQSLREQPPKIFTSVNSVDRSIFKPFQGDTIYKEVDTFDGLQIHQDQCNQPSKELSSKISTADESCLCIEKTQKSSDNCSKLKLSRVDVIFKEERKCDSPRVHRYQCDQPSEQAPKNPIIDKSSSFTEVAKVNSDDRITLKSFKVDAINENLRQCYSPQIEQDKSLMDAKDERNDFDAVELEAPLEMMVPNTLKSHERDRNTFNQHKEEQPTMSSLLGLVNSTITHTIQPRPTTQNIPWDESYNDSASNFSREKSKGKSNQESLDMRMNIQLFNALPKLTETRNDVIANDMRSEVVESREPGESQTTISHCGKPKKFFSHVEELKSTRKERIKYLIKMFSPSHDQGGLNEALSRQNTNKYLKTKDLGIVRQAPSEEEFDYFLDERIRLKQLPMH